MQFTIRNKAANWAFMKLEVIMNAKTIIIDHNITHREYRLNQYLMNTYGVDLKATCLHLLNSCKMYRNKANELTILFPKKEDDKLAALITYGNGSIPGSNLLKEAFFRF